MKNNETISSLHLLKSQLATMDAELKRLDHLAGSHMKALNILLSKGIVVKNVKAVNLHLAHGNSLLEQLALSSWGALSSAGVRNLGAQLGDDGNGLSSGDGMRISQGQLMGQLASSISRTIARNL